MRIKHILIDLDGVLTDFVGSFCTAFGYKVNMATWTKGEFGLHKLVGITEDYLWKLIADHSPQFWANMSTTPFYTELMDIVRATKVPFTICTSPSNDPQSAAGKIMWIQDYFGVRFRDFMIGPRKELLAKGTVLLIDDYDKNLARFKAAGGKIAPIPAPWNSYKGDPLFYVKEALL